ncbi:MAG TPA: tetratricopeptide repeat protein, partial [Ktedonobacterales bacterium]|nr:tetratricopeptide repeat protein [Ktedonobacterales bacterium]
HLALRERGHLYSKMKRYEESVADFQRALELDDSAAYDWHSLAWSFYKLGRYNEALPAIDRAVQIDPAPAIVGTKGEIFNRMGRYAEALDWLDRALARDPYDKEHLRERVVALRGLGRLAEADEAEAQIVGE